MFSTNFGTSKECSSSIHSFICKQIELGILLLEIIIKQNYTCLAYSKNFCIAFFLSEFKL